MKIRIRSGLMIMMAVHFMLPALFGADDGTPAPEAPPAAASVKNEVESASVVVWGRSLVEYRLPLEFATVQQRAKATAERISDSLGRIDPEKIIVQDVQVGRGGGLLFTSGGVFILGLMEGDLAPGVDLESESKRIVDEIRQLALDHAEQHSLSLVIKAVVQAVIATIVFFAFWTLLAFFRTRLLRFVARRASQGKNALMVFGYDWRPVLLGLAVSVARLLSLMLVLTAGYVWVTFVLSRFPYTRQWGEQLGGYLTDALGNLAGGAVHQIPNIVALVVIFVLTRGVIRILNGWFSAIESGKYFSTWLDPEAARASRRLADIGVWIVALVVAFPYLPGSHSQAFKGISVFLGLLVSLGGAGFVGQIIGGLAAVYSKSVRPGDFIRVGETEGTVKELGMFSCRIVTRTREEVTIPNSMLVNSAIRNFSRVKDNATLITTGVTIGYDTPWRQVEAMLLKAAAMTDGVVREPRSRVLQTALDDFYVRYELNVCAESAYVRAEALARLHGNIQDVFNEHGVQIMSPHFRGQPDAAVVIPKEKWYAPPAEEPKKEA